MPNNGPTAISQRQQPSSNESEIVKLLIVLAEARQAPISEGGLELFSRELSYYAIEDIRVAIRKLMFLPREQYAPPFPALGTIVDEVEQAKIARLKLAREAAESAEAEEERRHQEEHPEAYFNVGDMIHKTITAKVKEKPPEEPRPSLLDTLRNSKPRPRATAKTEEPSDGKVKVNLSVSQFRQLADAVEKNPLLSKFSPAELRALADLREKEELENESSSDTD